MKDTDDCAQRQCQNGDTCVDCMDDCNFTRVAGFTRKNCSLGNNSLTTAIIKIKSKYDQNKTKL